MTSVVGVIFYFFFSENETDTNERVYKKKATVRMIKKKSNEKRTIKVVKKKTKLKTSKTKKTILKKTKKNDNSKVTKKIHPNGKFEKKIFIEQIEEGWVKGVKNFFLDELGLSESEYAEYLEIRKEFMDDRKIAYEHYTQKMKDKYGEDYLQNPSAQNDVFINSNYSDYMSALEKLIDRPNIEKYLRYKSEYNDSLEDIIDDEEENLFIEY